MTKSIAVQALEEKLTHIMDEIDILNATQNEDEELRETVMNKKIHLLYAIDILESTEKIAMAGHHMFFSKFQEDIE